MNENNSATTVPTIAIGDSVTFSHQARSWTGTVVKTGRAYAHVVCESQRGFRVPYALLTLNPHTPQQPVHNNTEHHRAALQSGDHVQFDLRDAMVSGVIAHLNPKRAHVIAENGREYRVSYGLLRQVEQNATASTPRTAAEMEALAGRARELLALHQLPHWNFQFDNGRKRAGCCQYGARVISLSYEFAKRAADEEIRDTMLHEIAHALVGKAHNHDEVWRAKAIEIGCSGKRCHDLQFTPPRYIMHCTHGCWVTTAERRKRGVICSRCRGNIAYETYTDERWQRMQQHQPPPSS